MDDLDRVKEELEEVHRQLAKPRAVYLAKERKISKFSGRPVREADPTADEWIDEANQHLSNITGRASQVDFLLEHLTGQAKDEVKLRLDLSKACPSEILSVISKSFQTQETCAQLQSQFYQRNQREYESLQAYSLHLMKLLDRIVKKEKAVVGDTNVVLKERFIEGVRDLQLRREMKRFHTEHPNMTFDEYRDNILKWCEDEGCVRVKANTCQHRLEADCESRQVQTKTESVNDQLVNLLKLQQEQLQKQQEQLDMLTAIIKEKPRDQPPRYGQRQRDYRDSSSFTCYGCGGRGHKKSDCPSSNYRPGGGRRQFASRDPHTSNDTNDTHPLN